MHKFVPRTQTINPDREYFIHEGKFYKYDNNIERGLHESFILRALNHKCIPKVTSSYVESGRHLLIMEKMPGETLENLKLSPLQKHQVIISIFDLYIYLLHEGIIHGDINVSNVLYDPSSLKTSVIDWEMARNVKHDDPDMYHDLYGPPWGIMDLIGKI